MSYIIYVAKQGFTGGRTHASSREMNEVSGLRERRPTLEERLEPLEKAYEEKYNEDKRKEEEVILTPHIRIHS